MEVAKLALPPIDTSSSNCSTPYISAPSSPRHPTNFFFCSAPTSPRSSSSFFSSAAIAGELRNEDDAEDDDFEFDFSGQLDMMVRPSLSSADELFDGGKIKPLKPPPAMFSGDSPKSLRCPIAKFREALSSPRQRRRTNSDPFDAAFQSIVKSEAEIPLCPNPRSDDEDQSRGRSKNPANARSNSRSKGMSRSLSPLRVSEFALLHQSPPQNPALKSSKRWRLKDFLLFRSASDGRAAIAGSGKDPLKKYFSMASKKADEGSFRSTASMADGSISRRRGRLSAHELHYTANRAVSEERKKKTSLPYKPSGILGCLGFNPALQKAFGSFASSSFS